MRKIFTTLTPLAVFVLGAISVANATVVTYGTSGVFKCNGVANCTAVGNVATVGGLTLTYEAQPSTVVNANPLVSANYGDIIVTGGPSTAITLLSNLLLDITINQTGPFAQSTGIFSGILTGSLGITGGNSDGFATICFVASNACASQIETITYAGDTSIVYKLQTPQNPNAPPANGYTIRATSTKSGDPTSFQGSISAVPEPSSYVMFASGLLALGTLRRRKTV